MNLPSHCGVLVGRERKGEFMGCQKKTQRAEQDHGLTPCPALANASIAVPALLVPGKALLQRKYRNLIRKHLDKLLDKLFADITGLHFHISWAPAPPRAWDTKSTPTACSVCCRLSGSPLLPGCRRCGPRQLALALSTETEGHHFTCRLGVRNCWLPIRIRAETLGIAYLQALSPASARIASRQLPAGNRGHVQPRELSRLEFARATRLLQLIVKHVQAASLSDLRKADLTSAGRAVLTLEKEQARLHEALHRHLPTPPRVARHSGSESHAEQIVHSLMEHIERDYAKPLTLQHCASALGMNAAYLSALFSHAVGVPFKTHLTELRIEKAKTLLGDSAKNLSDVAAAVGYASENRFRIAFKNATGLSPKLWRDTMQTNLPQTSP